VQLSLSPPPLQARRLMGAPSSSDATGSRSSEMGRAVASVGRCTTTRCYYFPRRTRSSESFTDHLYIGISIFKLYMLYKAYEL
jgi:hypothetical protein